MLMRKVPSGHSTSTAHSSRSLKHHVEDRLFTSCIHSNGAVCGPHNYALFQTVNFYCCWIGEIRREPTVKYYKECIRAGVPTSRQEKVQKIGAFSAYAETPISSTWS